MVDLLSVRWFKYKERRLLGRGVLSNALKKEVVLQLHVISPAVLLGLPNQSPSLLQKLRLIYEPPQAKGEGGALLASKPSLYQRSMLCLELVLNCTFLPPHHEHDLSLVT